MRLPWWSNSSSTVLVLPPQCRYLKFPLDGPGSQRYFSQVGRMKCFIGFFIIAAVLTVAQSGESDYSYSAQYEWPGSCLTGKKQSPINVITRNVQCNSALTSLWLSHEYYYPMDGLFKNKGHTVQFTPKSGINARMMTPIGTYKLLQVHMHWGTGHGQGSEHFVDGVASELEVHFVHQKEGAVDTTACDYYAVLGVRGSLSYVASSGIFSQLDVTNIKTYGAYSIHVHGISLSDLLPSNLDYYYYQGSLTTPGCDETVQWFLLKNTISVPSAYLANLREVLDKYRHPVTSNYRYYQALNGRVVQVCQIHVLIMLLLDYYYYPSLFAS